MTSRRMFSLLALTFAAVVGCSSGGTDGKPLRLATTTSVQDSGLLGTLIPAFESGSGRKVEVSAVGSGKAIELLRSGEADVALTHSPEDELRAVAAGEVGARTVVMRNGFVIVGPPEHAQVVAGETDAVAALRAIAGSGHAFVSRGDGSGTHQREQALWVSSGVPAERRALIVANAGMGEALRVAAREHAFTLSDRATYLAQRGGLGLVIVFQGGSALDNVYSVLEPAGASNVDAAGARVFADFMGSDAGRDLIGGFGVQAYGEPLFTPIEVRR
jgi:tungstate transport system substrate-binding protein